MSSKTVKLTTSSFIFIWMSSIVFFQVAVGVPLPFRESQTIPSYQSKPLELPPLGSRNFKHAHPHTHTYHQGSMSSSRSHYHVHEKGFTGGPTAPGRPKRHNEVHFGHSNDHLNHQNPYPHLNQHQHDDRRHDHQSFDNDNFQFQHYSMHQHQNQQQYKNHIHPNTVHPNSRAHNFLQNNGLHTPKMHYSLEEPEVQETNGDNWSRVKRDTNAPHIFYFDSDWEPDQNKKFGSNLLPHIDAINGYCSTLDCFERSTINSIRQTESYSKPVYDEVKVQDPMHPTNSNNIPRRSSNNPPRVVQISPDQRHHSSNSRASNGDDRNSRSNNKIPLPSQILIPPQQQQQTVPVEEPQDRSRHVDESWNQRGLNFLQQHNNNIPTEDFGQFYGQYPSIQLPPANYLDFPDVLSIPQYNGQYEINPRDSLPLDNSWNDFNSFFNAPTPVPSSNSGEDGSKNPPDVIRMRASGIAIGPDGLQIVKVILNFSNEDDEETHLEVEADQY